MEEKKNQNQKRHTDVLVEEVTRANNDSLTPSGRGMCRAHMRIRREGHVNPVPLVPQLRASPRTRERVVDLPLGRVDLVNRPRGAERRLCEGLGDKD